jgi:excisionase family DNA binding protein
MTQLIGKSNTKENQMDRNADGATLTVDQAHGIIGENNISRGGFYAAINRNEVPHLRLGSRILIPRSAFMRWLEAAGGKAVSAQ